MSRNVTVSMPLEDYRALERRAETAEGKLAAFRAPQSDRENLLVAHAALAGWRAGRKDSRGPDSNGRIRVDLPADMSMPIEFSAHYSPDTMTVFVLIEVKQ